MIHKFQLDVNVGSWTWHPGDLPPWKEMMIEARRIPWRSSKPLMMPFRALETD